MFSTQEKHGSRPWAAHIIILITDGYSHDPKDTLYQASVAKERGIQIFTIGVGNGVDEEELHSVASNPDGSHVFLVESYDALQEIEKALTMGACHSE
jgi:collagen type VI alpha